jgi:hypothetical protein
LDGDLSEYFVKSFAAFVTAKLPSGFLKPFGLLFAAQ